MSIYLGQTQIDKENASFVEGSGSLEIGDIGITLFGIDESQNKRRYLNGQIISQVQFSAFTTKLKSIIQTHPSIVIDEATWQAEVTASKVGQCGKFVIDDELGTIRLPKVVNISGLQDLTVLGGIKAESLPNITGAFSAVRKGWGAGVAPSGAFSRKNLFSASVGGGDGDDWGANYNFSAAGSSATYQDNAPVQQEAIQYPYFIQVAAGSNETIIDTSTEVKFNNPFSLLDYRWSEYEIKNSSWLISNNSFHDGTVYKSAYNLLLNIYNNIETRSGINVKLSTEEYTDYEFVLNTDDTTFRLPVKVKGASSKAVVGNGFGLGIDTSASRGNYSQLFGQGSVNSGSDVSLSTSSGGNYGSATIPLGLATDPTKSGIETSSQDMYLYFYVGETIQNANLINTAGVLTRIATLNDEYIVNLSLPDYSGVIQVTSPYTAPVNGYVIFNISGKTNCTIGNNTVYLGGNDSYNEGPVSLLLSKREVITFTADAGTPCFVPLKGTK